MDIETTMISETKQVNAASRIIKQAGLGGRLRAARESMRISEKDAATRLHLNPKIISIMENEQFENGPPETFMRGYIRSYARLLCIPDTEICAALTQLEPAVPVTQSTTPTVKTRPAYSSYHYLRSMTYVVVAILAILVSVWWTSHPKDTVTAIKQAPVVTNTPDVPAAAPAQTISHPAAPVAPVKHDNAKPAVNTQNNVQPVTPPTAAIAPSTPAAPQQAQPTNKPDVTPTAQNATVTPNAPATVTPPTPAPSAQATAGNIDDMDMSLSDPSLEQGEDSDVNHENDTKYNNTH